MADGREVRRVLDRMAAFVHGAVEMDLALIGIRRRGVPLAEALARCVRRLGAETVLEGEVEI